MRRSSRSARIASVCLLGKKTVRPKTWPARLHLIDRVIQALSLWQGPIDALVFPGAYLRTRGFIGHLDHDGRVRALLREQFAGRLAAASEQLEKRSRGAVLVLGCDSAPYRREEMGDHGCLAFKAGQIAGYARKIFPAGGDTTGDYLPIVPTTADYASVHRFVRLANGQRAMLAACYDLFGLTEDRKRPGRRSRHIRWLWHEGAYYGEDEEGPVQELRQSCMRAWHYLLDDQKPELALCAIHGFKEPGLDGYWQRHGIAAASAMLRGGLVVGAAHFWNTLPLPESSTLAARDVSQRYVSLWANRPMESLKPIEAMTVTSGKLTALVRLFEG